MKHEVTKPNCHFQPSTFGKDLPKNETMWQLWYRSFIAFLIVTTVPFSIIQLSRDFSLEFLISQWSNFMPMMTPVFIFGFSLVMLEIAHKTYEFWRILACLSLVYCCYMYGTQLK